MWSTYLLCLFLSGAFALNYHGCQTLTSASFASLFGGTFSSDPVPACQTTCTTNSHLGSVGVGHSTLFGQKVCYCGFVGASTSETNCPVTCPGSTVTTGTHCGGSGQNFYSVYENPCFGICDDPHFTGLDGSRYDYTGTSGRVVALISDRSVQINSLFVPYVNHHNQTFLGPLGIRVCNVSARVFPNGSVIADQGGFLYAQVNASLTLGPAFVLTRISRSVVRVIAGSWRMSVALLKDHINIFGISHLDPNDTHVHGVYGITGNPQHRQVNNKLCQPRAEGGCELPGKWEDYEFPQAADLCSTEWTYTSFDSSQCYVMAQRASILQAQEDDRLAADERRSSLLLHAK